MQGAGGLVVVGGVLYVCMLLGTLVDFLLLLLPNETVVVTHVTYKS